MSVTLDLLWFKVYCNAENKKDVIRVCSVMTCLHSYITNWYTELSIGPRPKRTTVERFRVDVSRREMAVRKS